MTVSIKWVVDASVGIKKFIIEPLTPKTGVLILSASLMVFQLTMLVTWFWQNRTPYLYLLKIDG